MRKLTLDLNSVEVESFDTGAAPRRVGTVEGHQRITWTCPPPTSPDTCAASCGCGVDTAWNTCGACGPTYGSTCPDAGCGSYEITCMITGPARCCAV